LVLFGSDNDTNRYAPHHYRFQRRVYLRVLQYVAGAIVPGMTYCQILTPGSAGSRTNNYFNPGAFCTEPAIGNGTDFGNSGVGIVRGPGQNNFDLALSRRFPLAKVREGSALELRSEYFNAFNRVQYSNPGTAFGTASFGVIGSASAATSWPPALPRWFGDITRRKPSPHSPFIRAMLFRCRRSPLVLRSACSGRSYRSAIRSRYSFSGHR